MITEQWFCHLLSFALYVLSEHELNQDYLKVSKSQKQIMWSWILPKNEGWGNFQYLKLPQLSFLGRIQDNIFFFEIFWHLVFYLFLFFFPQDSSYFAGPHEEFRKTKVNFDNMYVCVLTTAMNTRLHCRHLRFPCHQWQANTSYGIETYKQRPLTSIVFNFLMY